MQGITVGYIPGRVAPYNRSDLNSIVAPGDRLEKACSRGQLNTALEQKGDIRASEEHPFPFNNRRNPDGITYCGGTVECSSEPRL